MGGRRFSFWGRVQYKILLASFESGGGAFYLWKLGGIFRFFDLLQIGRKHGIFFFSSRYCLWKGQKLGKNIILHFLKGIKYTALNLWFLVLEGETGKKQMDEQLKLDVPATF